MQILIKICSFIKKTDKGMVNPLLIFTLSPNFANTHCKLSISKVTLLQPMQGMSLAALFVVNDANDVTAIIISVFVEATPRIM